MTTLAVEPTTRLLPVRRLNASPFSLEIYGDPDAETDGLLESVRERGVLVPLVVVREETGWGVVSGHRRLACARFLGLDRVPCEVREIPSEEGRRRAVLDYNRQRRKTFGQMMREASALEALLSAEARRRSEGNLAQNAERRDSDGREGRTDSAVARAIGIGGKDVYRQARAVWKAAEEGDARARAAVAGIEAGSKTIHAAYKDLRRRDRFSSGFRPSPYDVWAFRHDRAFGVPHPGSIPPAIVAHAVHYFTAPGDLVVDPMAGGGTVLDVCRSMGRRCLAYDIHPIREEIAERNVKDGFPPDASGCRLIFVDPPYHTMKARGYGAAGVGESPLADWIAFLQVLARDAFATLADGGYFALLLASQTEKDLPAGVGYIDHAFLGYQAMAAAGFVPERRISCPMDGHYLPQHVRKARAEGRMLGQVRDLLVMRKPDGQRSAPYWSGSPPASS